jgi:ArsR family transcriptional regulator
MTIEEEVTRQVGHTFQAAPSLACDLSWALSVAVRSWRGDGDDARAHVFAGREGLAERVRSFWGDASGDTCYTEMQVLAHHAGAIVETSPDALWAAIERAVQTVPLDLGLESENAHDRANILTRLRMLKESPDLVRRYLDLLCEVWEPLDDRWQASLPLLAANALSLLDQLERGRPVYDLMDTCEQFESHLPQITANLDAGRPLLLVPCFFFGKSLYLEFPGLILVGVGITQNDLGARARTESVARRLKSVADPTRLALLHFLATRPSTVGSLATSFGLAQPTVSMHVKVLREAGLVRGERVAGKLQLRADTDAVELLLADLRAVVGQGASTTGSDRMPATVVDLTRSAVPVTA